MKKYGSRAAIVQAGFGTLYSNIYGAGGNVFRTEVELDGSIDNIDFTFGDCVSGITGSN